MPYWADFFPSTLQLAMNLSTQQRSDFIMYFAPILIGFQQSQPNALIDSDKFHVSLYLRKNNNISISFC